jgi:sugar diacid utilization regulator
MKIHRNTILNRLNKIREITYLDPKVFKDSVILYLTLMNSEEKVLE